MFRRGTPSSAILCDKDIVVIHIAIKRIEDVFKTLEYTVLKRRKINDELEGYIIKEIKNHTLNKKILLVFHVLEDSDKKDFELLRDTVWNHFYVKARETEIYLKQQFCRWSINMIIGILFLILCIILIEIFEAFSYIQVIRVIKESLLIIGWVALSEPMVFILFGRQNIKKDMLYYKRLSNIPIIIEKYMG